MATRPLRSRSAEVGVAPGRATPVVPRVIGGCRVVTRFPLHSPPMRDQHDNPGALTTAQASNPSAGNPDASADHSVTPRTRATTSLFRWWLRPAPLTVLVWLLTAPVEFLLPTYAGLNPFYPRAVGLSIGAALTAVAVGLAVALRFPRAIWPPVAAGLLASWTFLALRVSLHGTPFGFGGLRDDAGRITAMAVRHSATWVPSDAWIPGLPSEYPPLYFLVTGRLAALLDIPAWRVLPDVAAFVIAATVVVLFLLWQRLVPGWV